MSDAADLVVRHAARSAVSTATVVRAGRLLERQFSPELIEAFAAFRRTWDPSERLNPEIIVDPPPLTSDLRATAPTLLQVTTQQAFSADGGDFRSAVERCIGVGRCVSTQGAAQMCRSFRATLDERHSTRGRARLLQEIIDVGASGPGWLALYRGP